MVHFLKKFLSNVQQKQYITCGKIEREGKIFQNKSKVGTNLHTNFGVEKFLNIRFKLRKGPNPSRKKSIDGLVHHREEPNPYGLLSDRGNNLRA